MSHPIGALIALLFAASAATAAATPATFAYTGAVSSDPFGLISGNGSVSGTYTFDSDALDAIPAVNTGSFASSGPAFGMTANVDGNGYAVAGAVTVNTANNIPADQYGVIAADGGLTLELFLEDTNGTALGSDTLPVSPPSLAAFALREFRLFGNDLEFLGSIDSLTCVAGCETGTPLPEPDSLLLTAAGLWALAGSRRRTCLHSRS